MRASAAQRAFVLALLPLPPKPVSLSKDEAKDPSKLLLRIDQLTILLRHPLDR